MAKARQSEAKTQLSSLYTAQKAFFAEYTAYDSRFQATGYSPEGNLRYNVGFGAAGFVAGVANGYTAPAGINAAFNTVAICGAAGVMNAQGCSILNGATNAAPPAVPAGDVTTSNTFVAGAAAIVHQGVAAGDFWTMDQNKAMINTASGIP